jgi:hypothetical protein
MPKHKKDKVSKIKNQAENKAGQAPQTPKMGSNDKNQYR